MIHETETIVLKRAQVDRGMIEVVTWLNEFLGVNTKFSCEGTKGENGRPYVLFSCNSMEDLLAILREIRWKDIECYVDWELEEFPLRYKLEFRNRKVLKEFSAWIKEIMNEYSLDEG